MQSHFARSLMLMLCIVTLSIPPNTTTHASAYTPSMVKDIYAATYPAPPWNTLSAMQVAGSLLYFIVDDETHGRELWRTDATSEGTRLLTDMTSGIQSSQLSGLMAVGSKLVFVRTLPGTTIDELWISDGSEINTTLIVRSANGITPLAPLGVDGTDFLFESGAALWKSNGTVAGTFKILDGVTLSTNKTQLWNSKLYFINISNCSLWVSDGTSNGTHVVYTTPSPAVSCMSGDITVFKDTLFFSTSTTTSGALLLQSDGTAAGTTVVTSSLLNSYPAREFTSIGNMLFFVFDDLLWTTDGTSAGTMQLTTTDGVHDLTPVHGTLFFARWGSNSLWKSDGTSAGTGIVTTTTPEAKFHIVDITDVNGTLFFFTKPYDSNLQIPPFYELWKSDGTAEGTLKVQQYDPFNPIRESNPFLPTAFAGRFFFRAQIRESNPSHFMQSDGTPEGTKPFGVQQTRTHTSEPSCFGVTADALMFFAYTGTSTLNRIWKSDGTEAGTQAVAGTSTGGLGGRTATGNQLFVNNWQCYTTQQLNNQYYYITPPDVSYNNGLWKTDGTSSGTVLVKSTNTTHGLVQLNDRLLLSAYDSISGQELWSSDGTESGTVLVKDIYPGMIMGGGSNSSNPDHLAVLGNQALFAATDGTSGIELWRTDGTAAGTALVRDILPGSADSNPTDLTTIGDRVYFMVTLNNGRQIWKSDGTEAGTVFVKALAATSFTVFNSQIFFTGTDANGDIELWKTDGTEAGTILVKDINPTGASHPTALLNTGTYLYFTANDGVTGEELWRTDGTAAGTVRMSDIAPGSGGSGPQSLTMFKGQLFFSANDGVHGRELWSLSLLPALETTGPTVGAPGSYFPFVISNFTPGSTAAITLNGRLLTTVPIDATGQGRFTVYFNTMAPEGSYTLVGTEQLGRQGTAIVKAQITITIDKMAALLPISEESASTDIVQAFPTIYLPLVVR